MASHVIQGIIILFSVNGAIRLISHMNNNHMGCLASLVYHLASSDGRQCPTGVRYINMVSSLQGPAQSPPFRELNSAVEQLLPSNNYPEG